MPVVYKVYGWPIVSSFPLRALEWSDGAFVQEPLRVTVETHNSTADQPLTIDRIAPQRMRLRNPAGHQFEYDGQNRELLIQVPPDYDKSAIDFIILNQAVPFALSVEGELFLHASAVAHSTGAVLFMGPRGIGKSHFAALAVKEGHTFISDDFTRIVGEVHSLEVVPSFPEIRLFHADAESFLKAVPREGFAGPKSRLNAAPFFARDRWPLRSVFALERNLEKPSGRVPLAAVDRFKALMDNCLFYPTLTAAATERRLELIQRICEDKAVLFDEMNLRSDFATSLNAWEPWRNL